MSQTELRRMLTEYGACEEAHEWAKPYATLAEAWDACERGDWMLWLAGKAGLCSRQELVLAACACARLELPYFKADDEREQAVKAAALRAIEATERWARGEVTLDDVRRAVARHADYRTRAAYAARIAFSASASSASYVAAYAADAAYAVAAVAAAAAADAAYAVAADAVAADAADDAARTATLKRCAELVREQSSVKGAWTI